MFGSGKRQELEAKVRELERKLEQETSAKGELERKLQAAQSKADALESKAAEWESKAAELESTLNGSDVKQLEEQAKATIAEYTGLKELYTGKVKSFEDSKEGEEEAFARESALKKHNLQKEIADNRRENEEYVSQTVKSFTESYTYYLNQIKVLMDALGDVATRTGANLFSGETGELKAHFGKELAAALRSGTEPLRGDEGDIIVIGSSEEAEQELEDQLADAEAEFQAAEAELEAAEEEILEAEAELDAAEEEADALAAELESAEEEVDTLTEALEDAEEEADRLELEAEEAAEEAADEIAEDVAEDVAEAVAEDVIEEIAEEA